MIKLRKWSPFAKGWIKISILSLAEVKLLSFLAQNSDIKEFTIKEITIVDTCNSIETKYCIVLDDGEAGDREPLAPYPLLI